tara:strand:+ start:1831 stop:2547 length:717 start_codon:yes stop_codon:yes gene_type:complete
MRAIPCSLVLLTAVLCLQSPAWCDDDAKAEAPALATQGSLSQLEESFYELSYRKPVPGKKKPQPFKAYLEVGEGTTWFADAPARLQDLTEGLDVWLYGTPVESESTNENGQTVIERQVRGVLAIATGEALTLREVKVEKGPRWVRATVSKPGQALQVKLEGEDYRVLVTKACAILIRKKLDARPAKLKKKLLAAVVGDKSEARPKKAKAKVSDSFSATQLVILNKRLNAAYGLMRQPN